MNTRSHCLELSVTAAQVEEVAKALFHTILFHRTTGKFSYTSPNSATFSVGTVGIQDVDLTLAGFTYVRCESGELDQWLSQQIEGFVVSMVQQTAGSSGKITLEFFERKKGRWLMPAETVNWEVWHLALTLVEPASELAWQSHQQQLTDSLVGIVQYVAEVVNRPDYVPRNPAFENLTNVFDVRFSHVQPYLHRVTFEVSSSDTVAETVRKFIRNTFTYS